MRSIRHIQDIVDWGLCVGCGACYSICSKGAVSLKNIENIGIRPHFKRNICNTCAECLDVCPGYCIDARRLEEDKSTRSKENLIIGPTLEIWEGYAADDEIRFCGSSGGSLTAIALYCLEKENMAFVLHTGMHPKKPWENITVQSRNRNELLSRTGSRYVASSPCDSLRLIEESERPCVFIGKPCDTAAIKALRKNRHKLDAKLGIVLTFCCAGTPSTSASVYLLKKLKENPDDVEKLTYRGNGWPGGFTVTSRSGKKNQFLPYSESWSFLQKYRPFRCQLCPDGLGELGDISCCDAWHRYDKNKKNPGLSIVMARSVLGRSLLHKATDAGYLHIEPSTPQNVVKAQGLVERRKEIFGRLLSMKLFFIPTTRFVGFSLYKCWLTGSPMIKMKSILGTIRRIIHRRLWRRNLDYDSF